VIREATADDIPALVRMGMQFSDTVYADRMDAQPEAIAGSLVSLLDSEIGQVFVSVRSGQVTGVIVLVRFVQPFSGQVTVSELAWWVDPGARGHGVRLLQRAEQWAKEQGAVWLQVAAPSEAVGRLYERMGFEPLEVAYQRRVA
jgi:GNAT superfamily N-acetyltransferase